MENKVVLSKNSNSDEIKAYFLEVSRLSKSNEEFPVELDDVWPLVYERKDNAVKSLIKYFIQGIDYQLIRQKADQPTGSKYVNKYFITSSCLEFFIARKIRTVFEIYRQVFHKAVINLSLPNFEDPVEAALAWAEQYKEKQLALQKIEEDKPKVEYYNEMVENRDYFTISSIAIELKVTAASLNKFLLDTGWFTKKFSIIIADDEHKSWQCDVPYYQTKKDGTKYVMASLVRWSKKGRENIIKLWKSNNQKQENDVELY